MPQIGSIIAASARLSAMYAERLVKDITASQFARFARPGGVIVQSNHPAFIVGHLSLYPVRATTHLNLPVGPTQFPSGYEELFKFGVECRDDPDGTIYPPMSELTAFFFAAYKAAAAAVESAPNEAFDAPNPAQGRLREMFPTVGHALAFYLGGHMQVHLGQMSAWRRAMGLPSAM